MDWSNEEYVRVYTRDTPDDLELSWQALALWHAMLRRFDRSGLIEVRNGWASVARVVRIPEDVVIAAGAELERDGRVVRTKRGILAPNFTEAQTARKSDKARQQESRDRRRAEALASKTDSDAQSESEHQVTTDACHTVSRAGHTESRDVTLCSADPLLRVADPLPPVVLPAGAQKPDRPKRRKLPEGWEPARTDANVEAEAKARARGVDLHEELQKLHDWAKAGNQRKDDWEATWRNWTRNARPANGSRAGPAPPSQAVLNNLLTDIARREAAGET